jgi:hypothetical protein
LGANNCIQIGSYRRFTAITPVHDLDILYIIGKWNINSHNPSTALQKLNIILNNNYENPTEFRIDISPQTHSITIAYTNGTDEVLSVDIVPAYIYSKNDFGDDTYKVPEVMRERHGFNRRAYYEKLVASKQEMQWITSDPQGYISIASRIDDLTKSEFRKATKIIKLWKNNLVDKDENLKLKSFHLEQVIVRFFNENQEYDIFDIIFRFFRELPEIISKPNQIPDRANNDRFIDDYLEKFTNEQIKKIKFARDGFLIKLENFKGSDTIEELFKIDFYERQPQERFLFDYGIKTFIESDLLLKIDGFVEPKKGFPHGWITETLPLRKGLTYGPMSDSEKTRKIKFSVTQNNTSASEYRWKVRNCDECEQPRGEITPNHTKNDPERTAYSGVHYVECYAIKNHICIARSKVEVKIV